MLNTRIVAGGHSEAADGTPESGIVWIYHFKPDGTHELVHNQAVAVSSPLRHAAEHS